MCTPDSTKYHETTKLINRRSSADRHVWTCSFHSLLHFGIVFCVFLALAFKSQFLLGKHREIGAGNTFDTWMGHNFFHIRHAHDHIRFLTQPVSIRLLRYCPNLRLLYSGHGSSAGPFQTHHTQAGKQDCFFYVKHCCWGQPLLSGCFGLTGSNGLLHMIGSISERSKIKNQLTTI